MTVLIQQLLGGIAIGSIYAALALGIVLIYRATGVLNLAQGEMAMFSTFVAWQFWMWGLPIILAIGAGAFLSMLCAAGVERGVIRASLNGHHLRPLVVSIGLLLLFNQLAAFVWGTKLRSFPSPFPSGSLDLGEVRVSYQSLGTLGTVTLGVILLTLLFRFTRMGLAMSAVAGNRNEAPLVGIDVGRVLSMSWALGAGMSALAGALIAPVVYLDPNMMMPVLLYSFAAALLGGLDSLAGAVVGGIAVGVAENIAGTYVDFLGADLKILLPLTLIVLVLVVRPAGLFGRQEAVRV